MKTIPLPFKTIALLAIFAFMPAVVAGQVFSDKEKIIKSFPANSGTTLEISNKYGKVHILNWEKDSVRIEVDVTYTSNQYSKLQKAKDNVSFSFTGTMHFINAATEFGKNKSSFAIAMKDITESFITDNSLEINYLVYAPNNINLKIKNKYGDFYLDDHNGNLSLDLSNGNVKINEVTGNAFIEHKFGNLTIGKLNTAHFIGSYSELQLKEAEQLDIETKSSTINIEDVNILKVQSRRDKITVNSLKKLYGSTYFSDGNFQVLSKEINLNTHYGVFNFYSLTSELGFINLICKYSDFNLFFEKGISYNVDFVIKNTDFLYPLDKFNIEETYDEKEKTKTIKGKAGNTGKTFNFKLSAENGSFVISHK